MGIFIIPIFFIIAGHFFLIILNSYSKTSLHMKYFSLLIFLFASHLLLGQQTNTYEISSSVISNPERGLYHHTEVHSGNYNSLNLNTLIEYREEEAITQILRVFYLDDFTNNVISEEYLQNMHADFNTAREAGIKVIARFAYTKKATRPHGDATPRIVKNHIFQLKDVLRSHKDVIAVIQTGFIGAWGEWYYSDHFSGEQPWIVTDQNWVDRGKVVDDLLRVVPTDRMIQIRTPGYKMTLFDTEDPIESSDAFSGENISRVGHHNDCFVASSTDFGTYVNEAIEKPYLEEETKFLPMGGETCALAPPFSDCDNAYSQLQRFHWSYLNIDYNTIVLDVWQDQGCFDDVERNLGYRYALNDATLQTEVHPNGSFDLSVNLENYGFANPYNPRDFEIILKSTTSDQIYRLQTNEEMRLWPIGENFNVNIQAGFREDIIEDQYSVYLNFPDKSPSLRDNPAYSIQLANQNTWEENQGWNDLNFVLNINASFSSTPYSGSSYFDSFPFTESLVSGPTSIYSGVNQGVAILFWGKSEGHDYRRIERSTDGTSFETISTISASNGFYKIVENANDYYYRFALLGDNGSVTYSDAILVNAATDPETKISIVLDGMDEDWKDVQPTASSLDDSDESYVLRTHFSLDKASFSLYGNVEDYKIYLNTDQSLGTGSTESPLLTGMDYRLENGSLFKFENDQWALQSASVDSEVGAITEIELEHELFENLGNNFLIPIVAYLNNESILLSDSETYPSNHIRNLPPDIPANFDVDNSIPFPAERLEVSWEKCLYCEGYNLEKSDDGVDFFLLGSFGPDDEIYYHDFLPNGYHYYRIQSFNALGESDYSLVEIGVLGPNSVEEEDLSGFKLWPNPTSEYISTDLDYDKLIITTVSGQVVSTRNNSQQFINISKIPTGVYFFTFVKKEKEWVKKVVKF